MLVTDRNIKSHRAILIGSAFKSEIVRLVEILNLSAHQDQVCIDYFLTGIGSDNVRRCLKNKFDQTRYFAVLNVGTAGSVAEACAPLTVFCPDRFCGFVHDRLIAIEPETGLFNTSQLPPSHWQRGTLFSSSTPVTSASGRQEILENCQADAVDMEAFAYADFCSSQKIPFGCLKIITDRANSETDMDFRANLAKSAQLLAENVPILIDIILSKSGTEVNNG